MGLFFTPEWHAEGKEEGMKIKPGRIRVIGEEPRKGDEKKRKKPSTLKGVGGNLIKAGNN